VLDFQDAVFGPITYDLVSLLRDAYVAWPEELQLDWAIRWWESARTQGLPLADDFGEFWRDFEWMGLQRHLKVLGIFARLNYRDGKDRYLADMPRVLAPVIAVAGRYSALTALARLIDRVENRAARIGVTF
jgi:aminoglycoside/choline kinase family phosphotransferase